MNYGRDAVVLGGLVAVFVIAGRSRTASPAVANAPAAPAFAAAPPVPAPAGTMKHSLRRIASKKENEKPARRERGERLRERGEAFGGDTAARIKEDADKRLKDAKADQPAADQPASDQIPVKKDS